MAKKMENRYHVIRFPLKYVSPMPVSTRWFRVAVESTSKLSLSSHLIPSVTASAHWQGGRWEVMMQLVSGIGPLGNPYPILHCVPKRAADTQGLLFFFPNCLENFMLCFWLLAMNIQMHSVRERTRGLLQPKHLSSCVSQMSCDASSWRVKGSDQADDLAVKLPWWLSG